MRTRAWVRLVMQKNVVALENIVELLRVNRVHTDQVQAEVRALANQVHILEDWKGYANKRINELLEGAEPDDRPLDHRPA